MVIESLRAIPPLAVRNISMVSNKLGVRACCYRDRDSYRTNQTNDEQRGDSEGFTSRGDGVPCGDLMKAFLSWDWDAVFLFSTRIFKFVRRDIRIDNWRISFRLSLFTETYPLADNHLGRGIRRALG
jgi:hypothetical protein